MQLEIRNLVKHFGGIQALNGISLAITGGELVGMMGPNGSGKTTLVNTINGMHRADGGQIMFNGEEITHLKPNQIVQRGIGRTFQVPRAFRRMTVLENLLAPALAVHPGQGRRQAEARAREVLSFLTLDHLRNDYARSLSGGQQKLLELGQVLMTDPSLLLMDEPFAGVHPRLVDTIMNFIVTQHKQGKAFLIISHDLNYIFTLSQRLVVLSYGDIIADGDPQVVKHDERVIEAYLGEEADDA
jgi:branched-chain amino acid transport system ATP-binding protein